jgi:hypothetical protein
MWATTARLLAASAARSTAAPSTSGRTVLTAGHRLASTRVTVRLTTAVDGLGGPGETVAVRPGHARNFLIPQGLAIMEVVGGGRRLRDGKEVGEKERGGRGAQLRGPCARWGRPCDGPAILEECAART